MCLELTLAARICGLAWWIPGMSCQPLNGWIQGQRLQKDAIQPEGLPNVSGVIVNAAFQEQCRQQFQLDSPRPSTASGLSLFKPPILPVFRITLQW